MTRFTQMFSRRQIDGELSDEIQTHLDERIEELISNGVSRADASLAARKEFGNVTQTKEKGAEIWRWTHVEELMQDVRFGIRMLRKSPAFTAIAILTLALGIGASTTVFSLVNSILLNPLPYPHAEQIVLPWRMTPPGVNLGFVDFPWDRAGYLRFAAATQTYEYTAAFESQTFNLTGTGDPERLNGITVSAGFFPTLGVSPRIGRTFTPDEDQQGHEHEAVLSDVLWRDRFGADPAIAGRSIDLDGLSYTVIGVMPPGFAFPRAEEMPGNFEFPHTPQLWVPIALPPGPPKRGEPSELAVIGRLRPGVSVSQAQAEGDIFTKREEALFPAAKGWFSTRVTPLSRQVVGDTGRPLLLILGAVGVVLLIACSNVASLLLTRSVGRRREFTVRAALGAGKGRLVRQLFTESLLLALAAGILGIAFAEVGVQFVRVFGPRDLPRLAEVSPDMRMFAFALGIALLTGILFGVAPAFGAAREDVADSLRETGERSGGSATAPKLRSVLVVCEIALALVLVIAAGLLVRTFYQISRVETGFTAEHVLTFGLTLPSLKYPDSDHIIDFYNKMLGQLQTIPQVRSAGISEAIPLRRPPESTALRIPDFAVTPGKQRPITDYTFISPGYFGALGTPILRGRDFLASDAGDSMLVAIVNSTMAKRFWPGQDPIGKQVGLPIRPTNMTVVGVVPDFHHKSLRENTEPEIYVPYTQKPWPSMLSLQVAVRTAGDPGAALSYAREAIHAVDPDVPLSDVMTLSAALGDSMSQSRFTMLLLGAFGALALLMAMIGMYGVISYAVAQRTREIAIRMALGAERRSVFAMVLRQGSRLAALGIAIGVAVALIATRLMTRFLFGVRPTDPLTFGTVVTLLVAIALLASYIPAMRATRVDPMVALRSE